MLKIKGKYTCWKCGNGMIKQPKEFAQQRIINYKCVNCGHIDNLMPKNRSLYE